MSGNVIWKLTGLENLDDTSLVSICKEGTLDKTFGRVPMPGAWLKEEAREFRICPESSRSSFYYQPKNLTYTLVFDEDDDEGGHEGFDFVVDLRFRRRPIPLNVLQKSGLDLSSADYDPVNTHYDYVLDFPSLNEMCGYLLCAKEKGYSLRDVKWLSIFSEGEKALSNYVEQAGRAMFDREIKGARDRLQSRLKQSAAEDRVAVNYSFQSFGWG